MTMNVPKWARIPSLASVHLKADNLPKTMNNYVKAALLAGVFLGSVQTSLASFVFEGHSYDLTTVVGSWDQAEAEAIAKGGHLVAVNSAAEQTFLQTAFNNHSSPPDYYWIGFTDAASEGNWVWSNGDPVTFRNWAPWEPKGGSDPDAANENWAIMNFENTPVDGLLRLGMWHDVNVRSYQGIIETPVPEPSTYLAGLSALGMLGLSAWRSRK